MAHTSVPASAATSAHVVSFRSLPDLACANVGGRALAASDEFFAEAQNMLNPDPAVFVLGKFTANGKWMDGWESRRKRVSGYDWSIVQLGTAGSISGFTVDTSFFVGNYPESASVDALAAPDNASVEELQKMEWVELVPKSALAGGTNNYFGSAAPATRFTHVRLNIYPDGGVARFRVHGHVMPDWPALVSASKSNSGGAAPAGTVDVACAVNGAKVLASNDAFFGSHSNLILPERGVNMGDGWETRRKRVLPGHDWIVVQLGRAARVRKVEVDTNHFKGNFPDSALIEGVYIDPKESAKLQPMDWHRPSELFQFVELLPQVKLAAHTQHYYSSELQNTDKLITHVRMKIFPDGGVSRLRVWGEVEL